MPPLHTLRPLLALGLLLAAQAAWADPSNAVTLRLAQTLDASGDHAGAAIEFQRLAIGERDAGQRGCYLWAAGYSYWRAGKHAQADHLLDRMEDACTPPCKHTLLRAENALARHDLPQAQLYYERMTNCAEDAHEQEWAARRLAALHLRSGDTQAAKAIMKSLPGDHEDSLRALQAYEKGRDKKPWLGGLLGMIPGLGYFYAGEYANGARSLLLNGLFIYGMVDTAQNDQWGAFAIISFFEATWYAGSIFGGMDASHRYNQQRADMALAPLEKNMLFEPDFSRLPLLAIQFEF